MFAIWSKTGNISKATKNSLTKAIKHLLVTFNSIEQTVKSIRRNLLEIQIFLLADRIFEYILII